MRGQTPLCYHSRSVALQRGLTPLGGSVYIHRAVNCAVEIDGLDVDRGGRPVLRGLSARLEAGRVTGLLGPSGCGKTTLIRAIVGVQKVAGG